MASPGGGIELPLYTRINDQEIELGSITIPISTRLESDDDLNTYVVVTVGGDE